jgi:hypothetical protein
MSVVNNVFQSYHLHPLYDFLVLGIPVSHHNYLLRVVCALPDVCFEVLPKLMTWT